MISTLEYYEQGFKNLELVATLLEWNSDFTYEVRDTYFDFDQGWMWTTIIKRGDFGLSSYDSCQILYPGEWEEIVCAGTLDELYEIAKELKERGA